MQLSTKRFGTTAIELQQHLWPDPSPVHRHQADGNPSQPSRSFHERIGQRDGTAPGARAARDSITLTPRVAADHDRRRALRRLPAGCRNVVGGRTDRLIHGSGAAVATRARARRDRLPTWGRGASESRRRYHAANASETAGWTTRPGPKRERCTTHLEVGALERVCERGCFATGTPAGVRHRRKRGLWNPRPTVPHDRFGEQTR